MSNKFNNWQMLFTRSTITVKVTRLLALQVCLPITPLLILLLRNHGFWITEQPITFQMLICPQAQLRPSHLRPQLNSMTKSLSKMFFVFLLLTSPLNYCVVFTPHGCVLQDLATERMIDSGKQHAGLYYMSPLPNQVHAYQISTDPDFWHKRLGHPSPACLQLVSSLLPIPISKNLILIHNNCSIYPKAKHTRLPFHLSTIKSHSPFNILHCDIWGPHKTPTHFGKCFFSQYSQWLY